MRALLILGFAIAGLIVGCATKDAGQVQELGQDSYSVGLSRGAASGVFSSSSGQTAIAAAVARAGEFCHAKGQKYVHKSADKNRITFGCVSENPKPQ